MNKTAIIIGGVALVGVGAYLFFKTKATATSGAGETGTIGTTGTDANMPPAGSVFTTPEEVEAITLKISIAKDLADDICELKKAYNITSDNLNDYMNFSSNNPNDYMNFSIGGINLNPFQGGINLSSLSPIGAVVGQLIEGSKNARTKKANRGKAIKTVSEAIIKLKELGYKEVDCKLVKIGEV